MADVKNVTIEKFDLEFVDFITDKVCKTEPAYRVMDGNGNVLVICQNEILNDIDEFEEEFGKMTDKELKESGIKGKAADIKAECDTMRKIINGLDDASMSKIIECLPKYKNGLIKSSASPVYMTGMTHYDGDDVWCRIASIELSAVPWTIPAPLTKETIFAPDIKIKGVFKLAFTKYERQYDKKDVPVINKDLTYNHVEYKRNSYIRMDELIRGHIYMDPKEREFLYLGVIKCATACDCVVSANGNHGCLRTERPTKDLTFTDGSKMTYVFLQLNDKRKDELTASATFGEWMEKTIANQMKKIDSSFRDSAIVNTYGNQNLKNASSFKVVEDCGELFSQSDMLCDLDVTVGEDLTSGDVAERGFESYAYTKARTLFSVIDEVARIEYTVKRYDGKANKGTDLFKTFDSKEASKFVKDYLKSDPKAVEYTFAIGWDFGFKGVYVNISQKIVSVKPGRGGKTE